MSDSLLTRYLEAGFPHLRQTSRLPEWLVPDVAGVAHKLGDKAIVDLAEPLGLSERVEAFLARAPEPDGLPVEAWQDGISRWPAAHQVLPVTMALLRACEKVDAMERRGLLRVDLASLARALATIAYASFTPNGSQILNRLASILGGTVAEPTELLDLYTTAVVKVDTDTLTGVEDCIRQNPVWAAWTKRLLATGKAFPFMPRVIGVNPVPTNDLIRLLAAMVREVLNADSSRNYPN